MRPSWALGIALIVLTAGLAGCLGGDDQAPENASNGSSEEVVPASVNPNETESDANRSRLTYGLEAPVDRTTWHNGSFGPTGTTGWVGSNAGDNPHTYEISQLPTDAPVRIQAELTYETTPVSAFGGGIFLNLYSQGATFYTYSFVWSPGQNTIDVTVLYKGEPIIAEVWYSSPTGTEQPNADYQLKIEAESLETTVPDGAVVEIPAEPGQRFTLTKPTDDPRSSANDSIRALLYGPNDQTVTAFESDKLPLDITIPNQTAGDYVLMPLTDGPGVEIQADSDTTMRALSVDFQAGDPHPVQGQETVTWTFSTDKRPLAVGLYYQDQDSYPQSANGPPGEVTLTGPNGTIIDADTTCTLCIYSERYTSFFSGYGNEKVVAGEYEATYEAQGEAGYEVGHYVAHYVR